MGNAYSDLERVKAKLAGDVPNMGTSHDQSLVDAILEVSKDIDRKVAECRGDPDSLFSFLADQQYGRQRVYLSATPAAAAGTFRLTFADETTNPITFDATAADVQTALQMLSTVGEGNLDVTGAPGGPWTASFAGLLTGPQPTLSGYFDAGAEPPDARVVVLPLVEGVATVPSERKFRPSPNVYGLLVPIDDCVEVSEVRLYDSTGSYVRSLTEGADYQIYPTRGLPIEAVRCSLSYASSFLLGVVARWGHRLVLPLDVQEAATIEAIRSHLAGVAGMDDRLGMTPFGSVITAKAFTSKFKEVVEDYGHKLW